LRIQTLEDSEVATFRAETCVTTVNSKRVTSYKCVSERPHVVVCICVRVCVSVHL